MPFNPVLNMPLIIEHHAVLSAYCLCIKYFSAKVCGTSEQLLCFDSHAPTDCSAAASQQQKKPDDRTEKGMTSAIR